MENSNSLPEWKQFAIGSYQKSIEDQERERKEILFNRGRDLIKLLNANLGTKLSDDVIDEHGHVLLDGETFRLSGYDDIEILYSCPKCKKTLFVGVNTAKDIGAIFSGHIPYHPCIDNVEVKQEITPEQQLVEALKAVLK